MTDEISRNLAAHWMLNTRKVPSRMIGIKHCDADILNQAQAYDTSNAVGQL